MPAEYSGPKLVVLEQNPKVESTQEIIDKVMAELPPECFDHQAATWLQDKPDGELTKLSIEAFKKKGTSFVDMKEFHDLVNLKKTKHEQQNIQIAAKFTQWTFERVIEEVENIIEDKKSVKHSQIQKKIESCLDDEERMERFQSKNAPGTQANFYDLPLPVLIQSGGEYNIHKFQVDSSAEKLQEEAIYINVCGKYCDMASMASRTLIVNPTDEQKKAYLLALEAHDLLIREL